MEENLRVVHPVPPEGQRGMAELVADIVQDAQKLIRQELALVRTEIQQELSRAKAAAVLFAFAAVAFGLGGILLALALVRGLEALSGLPLWLDYGIISIVYLGTGFFLLQKGNNKAEQVDFVPRETVETVKENVQWIRNRN